MIILSTRRIILVSMILPGFVSCRNDLVVMAPYKDIPVVYCILNQKDSVHYLRLEKSFMGKDNAYEMARQTDSIYYPGASVFLERWADSEMKEQLVLERVQSPVRDSRIFTNDPNYLYQSTAAIRGNSEYRLNIRIPSTDNEITATTHTVNKFEIIKPDSLKINISFLNYDNYQNIEWITAPYTRIYHLSIRFHYLEVTDEDTVYKAIDWDVGHFLSKSGIGRERMEIKVLNRNFFKWVGNKIDSVGENVQRLADKKAIDFIFSVGGEELYTYLEIYADDSGLLIDKPVFTNIVNGIGLFSSRFEQSILGKPLSELTIDDLANGDYTKHLRFANSQNDYYYTGL